MESILYLLVIGSAIMALILYFDKKQSKEIGKVLKETKNVQPLFLLRSSEQKIKELNTKLYGDMAMVLHGRPSGRLNINEGARQLMAAELSKLISSYNTGQINLKTYNSKLTGLLESVNQLEYMSFEQIK